MKVIAFAAKVHVQTMVVALIEQSQPICSAKLEWDGDQEAQLSGDGSPRLEGAATASVEQPWAYDKHDLSNYV